MTTVDAAAEGDRRLARTVGPWWLLLVAGVLWLIYAFIVLSFDYRTVLAVAIFTGIGLVFFGVGSFLSASLVESYKWVHVVFGLASIGVGIACFVWPDITFRVLAALLAWFLLFRGIFDIVMAFVTKDEDRLWWVGLLLGGLQILIGFWAIGYEGRSLVLLAVWVGAMALARGIVDIFLAFRLRELQK